MAEDSDQEKTEEPTAKRLEDARKKGQRRIPLVRVLRGLDRDVEKTVLGVRNRTQTASKTKCTHK